jgi:uncharacterized protein (DUF2236 family)
LPEWLIWGTLLPETEREGRKVSGYFDAGSMAVRVMSNRAVGLTYGQRALVIGAIHPRLYVGTVQHTQHRVTPYNRLVLTARLFETVFLGSRDEADRALAFTRRKHATVRGALPEAAGPRHPAGTPYSAVDPELMFMTMAFAFDSVDVVQNLLVRPLTAVEQEGLYQDFVRWAELFGMPRSAAPADYQGFRARFDGFLASDEVFLTDEARVVGSYLAGVKRGDYEFSAPLRPLFRAMDLVVKGTLPERVRRLYGFRWSVREEAALRAVSAGSRAAHVRPPRFAPRPLAPIMKGRNGHLFEIISSTERRQLERGRLTMPEVRVAG